MEIIFAETKQHLGVDEPQNRTCQSARRTAPTGLVLYGLIVWWHETVRTEPARFLRAWPGKKHPLIAEMLAALREETLESLMEQHFSTPATSPDVRKFLDHLKHLLALAA